MGRSHGAPQAPLPTQGTPELTNSLVSPARHCRIHARCELSFSRRLEDGSGPHNPEPRTNPEDIWVRELKAGGAQSAGETPLVRRPFFAGTTFYTLLRLLQVSYHVITLAPVHAAIVHSVLCVKRARELVLIAGAFFAFFNGCFSSFIRVCCDANRLERRWPRRSTPRFLPTL